MDNQLSENEVLNKQMEIIYNALYLPKLDDKTLKIIDQYLEAYQSVLNEYLKSENPSNDLSVRLNILTGPINEIFNPYNQKMRDTKAHPAADINKERINNQTAANEKGFVRVLKNGNSPSLIEDDLTINGYTKTVGLIMLTTILGMLLAALLYYIK